MAGNWDIIVPEATTNLVNNPSITLGVTGYTSDGTNVLARSTATSKWGLYSASVQYQDDLDLARFPITLTATAHTFTTYVFLGAAWDGGAVRLAMENFAGSSITTATTSTTEVSTWVRLSITVTPVGGDLTGDLVIEAASAPTAGRGMFFDGVQCEAKTEETTYCDGDQGGCEWNGPAHASTSQRSAQSRAGGIVYDIRTQYGLKLGRAIGIGAAPQSPNYEEAAGVPGGSVSSVKTHGRVFTLTGAFPAADYATLHGQRQALYSVLDPEAVPETDDGPQPVILRYRGAAVTKEIRAHIEGGLEGTFSANLRAFERVNLRFLAADPYWNQIGQSAAVLDSNDTATLRYLGARLKSTGQWSDLGLTADPDTPGLGMFAVLRASDGVVYFGGDFEGFDNNAGWDYVVKYTPSTDTWARVGGASDFTGPVYAIAEGPDGTIYIGGQFENVTDPAGDWIVQYDGTTVTPVKVGGTGNVRHIVVGLDGTLYLGGGFVAWDGDADADAVVSYDGTDYAPLSTGLAGTCYGMAVAPDGKIWLGWTQSRYLIVYNPSSDAFETPTSALNDQVRSIGIDSSGRIFIGGVFTDADSNTLADRIIYTDGTGYFNMQTGSAGQVEDVVVAPDDMIYQAGSFTAIGALSVADRLSKWNGTSFLPLDINLTGSANLEGIAFGLADPVVPSNYDVWLCTGDSGTAQFAGVTTVTNNGTAPGFPQLVVTRSGGTSARLATLRNETTGKELGFDYSLRDGETVTVDLDPKKRTIISDFYGSRPDARLAGDDLGIWALQKGSNTVTCFVDVVGAPTVTAYLIWRDAYKAAD